MIDEWLGGVETLIANCTSPSVATRVGESTVQNVIDNRIADDHYEDLVDAMAAMPYFVIREADVRWQKYCVYELKAVGAIEVAYFEKAVPYAASGRTANAAHKLSKRYFVTFMGDLMEWIAANQGRGSTYTLPLAGIEMATPAIRTPISERSVAEPERDFWYQSWQLFIGDSVG